MNWSAVPIWHSSESDSEFISVVNYRQWCFLSIPQNHPLLSRVYWLHNSIFHLKKMDGPYFIATSPLVSYQFLHAHRNFTFMLCLFPWFCWINTLWKQDVLVWHNTRSGVTFDDNQYCHLYSKRLWAWYITLTIKVQHA